jgi:ABC-type Fe3+/spermidine/putrescine transport system ATPase subunit
MALLSVRNVGKTFQGSRGEIAGLHEIDLEVEQGELISLLGPSGCGKTTTLRCIAGLESPDHGEIELDGQLMFARKDVDSRRTVEVPPERRGLAMVFQNYALWPHMNVFNNVAFGLRNGRRSRTDIATMVEKALRNVQLWEHRDRRISQLSGGQQQRIAVARAMAPDPKIILFDEPLSNMDTQLRENMRLEILELQERMGLTSIWVTHDQQEALGMSSRIVLMNAGRVEQVGTPTEVWNDPASAFVAGFIGTTNRIAGTVVKDPDHGSSGLALKVDDTTTVSLPKGPKIATGQKVSMFVRTGAMSLVASPSSEALNVWRVPLEIQSFHGDYTMAVVRFGGMRLTVRSDIPIVGSPESVYLHIEPSSIMVYPES